MKSKKSPHGGKRQRTESDATLLQDHEDIEIEATRSSVAVSNDVSLTELPSEPLQTSRRHVRSSSRSSITKSVVEDKCPTTSDDNLGETIATNGKGRGTRGERSSLRTKPQVPSYDGVDFEEGKNFAIVNEDPPLGDAVVVDSQLPHRASQRRRSTNVPVSSPSVKRDLPVRGSSRRGSSDQTKDMSQHLLVMEASQHHGSSAGSLNTLEAIEPSGRRVTVSLILADFPYVVDDVSNNATMNSALRGSSTIVESKISPNSSSSSSVPNAFLGYDGNQYYCQFCRGFGDVVCCDGCPRVFHGDCVPPGPSRQSLVADDDPWYCPDCTVEAAQRKHDSRKKNRHSKHVTKTNGTGNERRDRSDRRRSSDEESITATMVRPTSSKSYIDGGSILSKGNTLEDEKNEPKNERTQKVTKLNVESNKVKQQSDDALPTFVKSSSNIKVQKEPSAISKKADNEESNQSMETESVPSPARKKKKKKKRKHQDSTPLTNEAEENDVDISIAPGGISQMEADETTYGSGIAHMVRSIPAFYFFLTENRSRIERALGRKHRTFNRLSKGLERNELVAREAGMWWVKLRPADHSRYMSISLRDFEDRIREWKQEKTLHEVGFYNKDSTEEIGSAEEYNDGSEHTASARDPLNEEEFFTQEKHERLFLSTSVGSKPFKLEEGQSYNRVLLDLLHDTRFHPLPMFCINRGDADTAIDEHSSKVTIPYFEVHGPVATSIGDECLGCTRGWLHHCSVLQQRIPAVEHRAKLQPPLSSLIATRIGLGLRPRKDRLEPRQVYSEEELDDDGNRGLFLWREADEPQEIKRLPMVRTYSVTDPSERVDDVVQFIEETIAMKVPEPPRPQKFCKDTNGHDPDMVALSKYHKCGRCRTIVDNDTGCVQCRRAQLVINKAKNQPSVSSALTLSSPSRSGKLSSRALKVHTTMLGRVNLKEGAVQSKHDQIVSESILKQRWCPSAVVPPQTIPAPKPGSSPRILTEEDEMDDDENSMTDGFYESTETQANASTLDNVHNVAEVESDEQEVENVVQEVENGVQELQNRRLRPPRVATQAPTKVVDEPTRREILREYKKHLEEIQKKSIQIACYGIFIALIRRDPLHLFALPVTAEGYNAVIKNPMDFGKIRDNLLSEKYFTLGYFCSDIRLLCENAMFFNPPSSIYFKTAKDMHDVLAIMQKRALNWIDIIKETYVTYLIRRKPVKHVANTVRGDGPEVDALDSNDDVFQELRDAWPEGFSTFESFERLKMGVEADFMRTQENETAYYGCWAVRRAAAAAEASLAPYPDSNGIHSVISKRKHFEDEVLRDHIDERVTLLNDPLQLKTVSTWREESVVRLMRKVQSRRLERRTLSESGCSRCDGIAIDSETKIALNADSNPIGKLRKKGDFDVPRVDSSRMHLNTGMGSVKTEEKIAKRRKESHVASYDTVNDACVSVRGSRIHGMGLYADQPFKKGDVVAEYIGEYIVNCVADEREKMYREKRIQDYQFRLNDKLVIDATMKGGHGRYINHNCAPNCYAKIVPLKPSVTRGEKLKDFDHDRAKYEDDKDQALLSRVLIIAQQSISINEEITYDYQFPLEVDLSARVPCNCLSDACRGFMNWDLPEKGANNRVLLVQKRGANMRDRIRRLGRPLKRDERDDT